MKERKEPWRIYLYSPVFFVALLRSFVCVKGKLRRASQKKNRGPGPVTTWRKAPALWGRNEKSKQKKTKWTGLCVPSPLFSFATKTLQSHRPNLIIRSSINKHQSSFGGERSKNIHFSAPGGRLRHYIYFSYTIAFSERKWRKKWGLEKEKKQSTVNGNEKPQGVHLKEWHKRES